MCSPIGSGRAGCAGPHAKASPARIRGQGTRMMQIKLLSQASRMPPRVTLMLIGCAALIIANAVSLSVNLRAIESATAEVNRRWAIIDKLRSIEGKFASTESSHRGYLLTGDATYLADNSEASAEMHRELNDLEKLVDNTPHQLARLVSLRALHAELQLLQDAGSRNNDMRLDETALTARSNAAKKLLEEAAPILARMEAVARRHLQAENRLGLDRFRVTATIGVTIGSVTLAILLLFYFLILRNILRREEAEELLRTANETLEAKVAARTAQLSHLSRHLLQIAEVEKATLANELHDELGSNLTAINLDVSSVATRLAEREPALAERLNRTLKVLQETVHIKRRIIQGLRPSMLESLGLSAAMQIHCEDFSRRTGLPCDAECADDFPDVEPGVAIALYRIAQEALNNVAKYAKATRAAVKLRVENDAIRIQIIDDGIGIDPDITDKPMVHGILGMRERVAQVGGTLVVRRNDAGQGTIVEAVVPLPAQSST